MDKIAKDKQVTKERGASFPHLSLPEAVKIIRDAGSYGKRHSLSALATYAGHSSYTSGPFKQKLAALREWGFITTNNGNAQLTDAAMTLVYPTDAQKPKDALRAAFQSCGLFWKIYEDSAKGIPLKPELLANSAVSTHRIGVSAKTRFLKSFVESAEAVELAQRLPSGEVKFIELSNSPVELDGPIEVEEDKNDELHVVVTGVKQDQLRPVVNQIWTDGNSEISLVIKSSRPLEAGSFESIGSIVTQIEMLWTKLGQDVQPPDRNHESEISSGTA
ncbi:MAG TPA: hypothetical protein VFO38_04265 [Candidatus Saccharimonadales bacterium]|nr:hypothetical protein [Candidatus Saccharimonadales bacterium]